MSILTQVLQFRYHVPRPQIQSTFTHLYVSSRKKPLPSFYNQPWTPENESRERSIFNIPLGAAGNTIIHPRARERERAESHGNISLFVTHCFASLKLKKKMNYILAFFLYVECLQVKMKNIEPLFLRKLAVVGRRFKEKGRVSNKVSPNGDTNLDQWKEREREREKTHLPLGK